jgi:hypothetical protein
MSFPLSSIVPISLSASVSDLVFEYVNDARGLPILTASDITISYNFLSAVKDFAILPEGMGFLTDFYDLSSLFDINPLTFNVYSYDSKDFIKNINVDVLSSDYIKTQFLITTPNTDHTEINIIPLKNSMNLYGEYGVTDNIRTYDGLYFLPESRDIFLQYRTNQYPKIILPDTSESIHLPSNIEPFSLASLKIIENGAYQGSCPANSDTVEIDKEGHPLFTDSGFYGETRNGEPLCVWASGGTLLERWYDPDNITQGDAYIANVNNDIFDSIIDITNSSTLSAKNKFTYRRMGTNTNKMFVDSLSSDLAVHFENWRETFIDSTSSVNGFIIESYQGSQSELEFDGSIHAHIPPVDKLHIKDNLSVGLWAYSDDWSKGVDTQLWGNFSNVEGYGLFYNTGATNELISFPTNNGFIYGFNFKGYKVFEKDVTSLSPSATDFKYLVTDYFGARWLWDTTSQKIIKLESDDLVSQSIQLPVDSEIKKMQINSQNELYVLNSTTNTISAFDVSGETISVISVPSPSNNFDILSNDTIVYNYSRLTIVDSSDNVYKVLGSNVYKNETVWYHFSQNIQTIKIDSDDAVYIFSNGNTLTKINSQGEREFETIIHLSFTSDTAEMSFVKENKNGIDFDILWVVFNTNKLVVKIDTTGRIIKRINLGDVVNLRSCGDFQLTTRGDFTGFDIKRKYENATSADPAFSLKLNLKCGSNRTILQEYVPAKSYNKGWVHLGFTLEVLGNNTNVSFYVNGQLQTTTVLSGTYGIDYGTKVSPFIMGGNSGRLGAKNVERSLNTTGYFIGKISDVRIYDTVLGDFEMKSIARNIYWNGWQPITLLIPTLPRTYLEKVDNFHLNKYPGFKSNRYNLKIKGISNVSDQSNVETFIRSNIKQISPANTTLNDIIFID